MEKPEIFNIEGKEKINNFLLLTNIYYKYFPKDVGTDPNKKPFIKKYHALFPRLNERRISKSKFGDHLEACINNIDIFLSPERNRNDFEKNKEILAQEYKIHLMPKKEHIIEIVEKLFEAIKNDIELKKIISRFKVIIDEKQAEEECKEIVPKIVIYTQLGKNNAQRALNKIFQYLKKYDYMGEDRKPRYNRKINGLIYYAQGSGDFKKIYIDKMKEMGKDSTKGIFDKDFVHFRGEYALENPSEKIKPRLTHHAIHIRPNDDSDLARQLREFRKKIKESS